MTLFTHSNSQTCRRGDVSKKLFRRSLFMIKTGNEEVISQTHQFLLEPTTAYFCWKWEVEPSGKMHTQPLQSNPQLLSPCTRHSQKWTLASQSTLFSTKCKTMYFQSKQNCTCSVSQLRNLTLDRRSGLAREQHVDRMSKSPAI